MVALWIQVLLLMGAAYFVGAALGCAIRRSLHRERAIAADERRVDPLPEVVKRSAQPASFGRVPEPAPQPVAPRAMQPAPRPAAAPSPPAAQPATQAAQDLKRIRLIDAGIEAALNKLGITRYEQIAAWSPADVVRFGEALGVSRARINQENWIEQAQMLAKGGDTYYSARRARGEGASAAPTPDEGESSPPESSSPPPPLPRPMSRAGVSAAVVTTSVAPSPVPQQAVPAAAVAPAAPAAPPTPPLVAERAAFAVPVRPTPPPERDNLRRIGGITEDIERTLNAHGVVRYSQIALWSPADVERFDKLVGTGGRVARENWIEQAQILSRGGDTRFSREFDRPGRGSDAPAPRPIKLPDAIREHEAAKVAEVQAPMDRRADLGSLRSVQALGNAQEPGPEAAKRAAERTAGVAASAPNDLKRIRGIGVLIEKKLNSMGVNGYEQIANWTADDIEHFSRSLDFKGRIERENWVEQARILASGGSTEFSRRVDRGEVESSRTKV